MKTFPLYAWREDGEDNFAICRSEKCNQYVGYSSENGPGTIPSQKIEEFETVSELANLLFGEDSFRYKTLEGAEHEASEMYEAFISREEYYGKYMNV